MQPMLQPMHTVTPFAVPLPAHPQASGTFAMPGSTGTAQTAPRMGSPRRTGCDVIYLAGSKVIAGHAQALQQDAVALGLTLKSVTEADMPKGLWQAINQWHLSGALQSHTAVALDIHGSMQGGQHMSSFHNHGGLLSTMALIRAIRESGLQFGLPRFDGLITIHMCYGGQLRELLAQEDGIHLICGGKKKILSAFGLHFLRELLPLLALGKAIEQVPNAEAVFNTATAKAPCTVSVSGKNLPTRVKYTRVPADLPGASPDRIAAAFIQQISSGKTTHVEQYINAWPSLLAIPLYEESSAFTLAQSFGRPDMVVLLLQRDEANWQADLKYLLPLAKLQPQLIPRVSVLINRVLNQHLGHRLSAPGLRPSRYREIALAASVEHLQVCLQDCVERDFQTLCVTLKSPMAPVDASAALDWQLIDMTGANAAQFINLPPSEIAQFKKELRSSLLYEMEMARMAAGLPLSDDAEAMMDAADALVALEGTC